MALSGTDDYNLTRDQIIRAAFENIGVAIANEPLEADDIAVASVALNALAMAWKAHGMHIWKRGSYTLSSSSTPALAASTYEYTLGGSSGSFTIKPMRIISVDRKDSDGNTTSLTRVSLDEWEDLPNKTTTGTPVNYYYEPQRTSGVLKLWQAPDATFVSDYSIEITYSAPIQDMDVGNEDVDFPNEWYDALILGLATRLAPRYGFPIRERELLELQAKEALDLVLSYDIEDTSVFFKPSR